MPLAQNWDDINKQLNETQKMLDPMISAANSKAQLIDKYTSGTLTPQSGGSQQVDPNETISIKNSSTGEQKTVKRSELPQYGLPIDYTPGSRNSSANSNPFYQAQLQQAQATQLDPIVKQQKVEAGKLSAQKQNAPIDLVNDLQTGMTLKQAMGKYAKYMSADDILHKYQQANKYGPLRETGKELKDAYGVTDSALGKGFGSISDKENTRIALEKLQKARNSWGKASKIPGLGPNTPGGVEYNSELKTLAEVLTRTLNGRGAVQAGIDRTISTLPEIGNPKYMIPGNADAAFNGVLDQILGGYTTKDLNLPASKHDQVMKSSTDGGIVKNVGDFLLGTVGSVVNPQIDAINKTMKKTKQAQEQNPNNPLGAATSATGSLIKNTVGNPSVIGSDVLTNIPLKIPGIGKGAIGAMSKMIPRDLNIAANTFKSLFTIPTKRAKDLMPLETSKKMVEYGITGSLSKMKDIAQRVTGVNGVVTNVVNDAVKNLDNVKLPVGTIRDSVTKIIDDSLELSKADKQQIKTQVGQLEKLKTSGDLLTKMRQFEQLGHQYLNKSTYLTNDIRKINIGKAYLDAAKHMSEAIDKAAGEKDVVSQLKTPQILQRLSEVSPKLAQDFQKAKTLKQIRSLEAPFVRLSKMIDLNEQQTQSAAANLGKRVMGAAGGFAIGNVPGAVIGALGEPIIEGAINSARAPILTRLAKQMGKMGSSRSIPTE